VDGLVLDCGGGDPDAAKPLHPDATGHVGVEFVNPLREHRYGVAWAWD
jgi:hypothetical protein